ncbi:MULTISPECIES: TetR family transcriptional regulator [Streptomyces]|uniref:TetR family transcriptional regulator n=1 Tax=Streptomyces fimbriatus TaxID=68197 RepID=A0ABW0DB31_STRFI
MHASDSDTDRESRSGSGDGNSNGNGDSGASAPVPAPAPPRTRAAARRSDSTRAAILHAARERFASDGYERATIRAIARDAKIDPSMVMRYYGSKEGLFAAAVAIDLELPDLSALPRHEVGQALARHFLAMWEENEVLTALLRVAATSRAGAERTQDIFRDQVLPVARQVCPDPEQVPARAALVSSQLLGLALTRYVLCFPPAAELAREEIVAWLGPTLQRYLTAPHPGPPGRPG